MRSEVDERLAVRLRPAARAERTATPVDGRDATFRLRLTVAEQGRTRGFVPRGRHGRCCARPPAVDEAAAHPLMPMSECRAWRQARVPRRPRR